MSNKKLSLVLTLALVVGGVSVGVHHSACAADSIIAHKKKDKEKADPSVKGSSDKALKEGSKTEKREKAELKKDSTSPARGFGTPSGY